MLYILSNTPTLKPRSIEKLQWSIIFLPFRYIFERIGLQEPHDESDASYHKNLSPGVNSSMDLTRKYLKSLSVRQIEKLVEIYRFDLEAFGYEYREFTHT